MSLDIILGVPLTLLALWAVLFFTSWSRRIIEQIYRKAPGSLREIKREIGNGQT